MYRDIYNHNGLHVTEFYIIFYLAAIVSWEPKSNLAKNEPVFLLQLGEQHAYGTHFKHIIFHLRVKNGKTQCTEEDTGQWRN